MDNWNHQFKSLLNSPLGEELIRTLKEDLADNLVHDAQEAESAETAYALLKESKGVIKALEHLQFRAVTPRDEGTTK